MRGRKERGRQKDREEKRARRGGEEDREARHKRMRGKTR